jgi:hypothetical protein
MKLDLLTNAMVVDDAIRFVASHKSAIEKTSPEKVDADIEDRAPEKQQPTATTSTVF